MLSGHSTIAVKMDGWQLISCSLNIKKNFSLTIFFVTFEDACMLQISQHYFSDIYIT